jgi:hypothetical protein
MHAPPLAPQLSVPFATHSELLQQYPFGQSPGAPVHPPVHCPASHVGVAPLHAVPMVCSRHPFVPMAHVTGAFDWHDVPAAAHPFVQHCAEPAAP